jgi:L-asparaginase II
MIHPNYTPLVELTRGPIVESIHYGAAVLVDSYGQIIYQVGDPQITTYLRSSSKPIQVLPFVEAGGVETYHLTDKELAILCASHIGMDEHVATVEGIQKKVGFNESNLMCGVHPPMHPATLERMLREGQPFTSNRHNCSGKHTGFLSYATLRGLPLEDYLNPEHPIQQTILSVFAEMCNFPKENVAIGIDGCSAPVFGVPLYNAAYAFARFCDPRTLPEPRAAACRKIVHAMTSHPDMVSGPGRFDTRLMEVGDGRLMVKVGAEGYQIIGITAGALAPDSPGMGLALKISDGDNTERSRQVAALHILSRLGVLNDQQMDELREFYTHPIYNWRKIQVGEIRPCFEVDHQF